MASNKERKLKIAIIVLSVLLAISLAMLVYLLRYLERISPATVQDNIITTGYNHTTPRQQTVPTISRRTTELLMSAKDPVHADTEGRDWESEDPEILKLFKGQDYDMTSFVVRNMFPGDALYKEYCVEVSHKGPVTVHFETQIRENTTDKAPFLNDVLECQIYINGELHYDGLMAGIPEFINKNPNEHLVYTTPDTARATTTRIVYRIVASLDTKVGNPYQGKHLIADFEWWVNEEAEETTPAPTKPQPDDDDDKPEETAAPKPTETTPPHESIGDGELVKPPKTGDTTVWVAVSALAAGVFLIILLIGRRRKEEEHEQ